MIRQGAACSLGWPRLRDLLAANDTFKVFVSPFNAFGAACTYFGLQCIFNLICWYNITHDLGKRHQAAVQAFKIPAFSSLPESELLRKDRAGKMTEVDGG